MTASRRRRTLPSPPDVFKALGTRLHAYAVFPPRVDPRSLEPLSIVELKQSDDREDRPHPCEISLPMIVRRVLQTAQSNNHPTTMLERCRLSISTLFSRTDPRRDISHEAWVQLQRDLEENVTSGEDFRQELDNNVTTVSTNSLRKFGAAISYPPTIAAGVDFVSEQAFESTIELSRMSIARYKAMPKRGDRSLLAIVKTQFTGRLAVSIQTLDNRKGRFGLLSAVLASLKLKGSDRMKKTSRLSGVLGVYLIVIPVKREGDKQWRFYPSFLVSGRELDEHETEAGKNDHLFQARKWAGNTGAKLLNEDGSVVVDVSESQSEFAHLQCLLAMQLRDTPGPNEEDDLAQTQRLERSSQMLRSAAELGSRLAMEALAVSYAQGLGVEQNVDHAEELERAAHEEAELPDPPQSSDRGTLVRTPVGDQADRTTSRNDSSQRMLITRTDSETLDTTGVRMRMRLPLPSGRLGREQNIWVEGSGGARGLQETVWWIGEDMQPEMNELVPLWKFGQLSTNDEKAMHMRTIVQEHDPVEVTILGYHSRTEKKSFAFPCAGGPSSGKSLRVRSLTSEISNDNNNEYGGLSCQQRVEHIYQECINTTGGHYFLVPASQSSIYQDYATLNTTGINIQLEADVGEVAEDFEQTSGVMSIDSNSYEQFKFVVEDSLREMPKPLRHVNRKVKRAELQLMYDQNWLFAKSGQDVRKEDSARYLRYGYYFIVGSGGINAQLYAVQHGSGAKLYVRDQILNTFVALHEHDYFVMKVSLSVGIPRQWQQSTAQRALRLRNVCKKAEGLDAHTLKREIVSIMQGSPPVKSYERGQEELRDEDKYFSEISIGPSDPKKLHGTSKFEKPPTGLSIDYGRGQKRAAEHIVRYNIASDRLRGVA